MRVLKLFAALILIVFFTGCEARKDFQLSENLIVGTWKSESYDFDGLKIPISPHFEVTESKMSFIVGDNRQDFELSSIYIDVDNSIVVDIKNGIGIKFHVVSEDRIYFKVPIIGTQVYYLRDRTEQI